MRRIFSGWQQKPWSWRDNNNSNGVIIGIINVLAIRVDHRENDEPPSLPNWVRLRKVTSSEKRSLNVTYERGWSEKPFPNRNHVPGIRRRLFVRLTVSSEPRS